MGIQFFERIITENSAYKAGLWIKPTGVFLHSLGCPGMTAEEAIKNMNTGADSNRMAVQAVIDLEAAYITLPIDSITKEAMKNYHGGLESNETHIGIEMTEPDSIRYTGGAKWVDLNENKTKQHITKVYNNAVEYVASLCEVFDWNPLEPGVIMTHKTGYEAGIATAHGDPEHIWDKLGFTLEQFKTDVNNLLNKPKAAKRKVLAVTPRAVGAICYVGDSRTNGLRSAIGSSAAHFIAKDSQGLAWLKSTAYSQVKSWLKSNPSGVVIFNFGVNDLYNIGNYTSFYKTVISENSGKAIYFMTVNPVEHDPYASNKEIESFNAKMKSSFPSRIIDTYSNLSFKTTDGLHYNTETYKAIHNYVLQVLGKGVSRNSTSLRTKLIQVAQAEVGTKEGAVNDCKYNDWYYGRHVNGSAYPWCHAFVSWCAYKAGMLDSFIPKTAYCPTGADWFRNKGWYKNRGSYTPQGGDIIYFNSGGRIGHVGIVKSCDGTSVHTIEGNSSDKVAERTYQLSDSYINGYGAYEGAGMAGTGSDGTSSSNLESLMPDITYTDYTVKKGDTIESIAKKFNTTVSMIIYLNDLDVSDLTNLVGKKLKVPENSNSEKVGSIAAKQVITKKSTRGVTLSHPYAKVSIFTETELLTITQSLMVKDTTMDLDILAISTNRDMSQDCPTFNVTLCFRRDWYEKIASNDLIIIEMCRPPESNKKVFFGLIDDARKSTDYNSDVPTRTISVTGRGFGKAFSRFEIGVISELSAVNDTLGFMSNSLDALANGSPAELTKSVIDFYLGKGCNYKFSNGKTYMDYYQQTITGRDDNYEQLADTSTFLSYQGTMNNFLKELRNAPFNEFFWEIYNNRPTFIFRPTPFNEPEWTKLHRIEIKDMDIVKESLGKSDVETYTVYKVNAETFLGTTDTIYFPLWYPPYYQKYGLSRLEVTSKYLTAGNPLDGSAGLSGGISSGDTSLVGSDNAEKIWNFLIGKGLSKYGAAGLMGNLEAESGLNPKNVENQLESKIGYNDETYTQAVDNGTISKETFLHPRGGNTQYGYGLAQWTSPGRKEGLYNLVKSRGVSIGDLATQLDWLYQELSSSYSSVLSTLKSATSVRSASDAVLTRFECPADQGESVRQTRARMGQKYYDSYANTSVRSTGLGSEEIGTTGLGDGFKTYALTDAQLKGLARLCQQEQGTPKGAAAEASLMANLFELKGSKYGSGASGLYNYVKTSGWFANASKWMSSTGDLQSSILSAVRSVLIDGKRTVPAYVDEHDCFTNITSATNDGTPINVSNRSAYVKNKTICKNRYGSTYTFYCFPDSTSDPFGYTSEANRQKFGDFCYDFSTGGAIGSSNSVGSNSVAMENEREATLARMADLFNWNILNNAMENGTLIVKGSNEYKVGERVIIESTGVEYYVEGVAHNFTFFQGWTTTLTLTRGIVPNLRYAPPWGKYQEMTMEDASKIFGYDVGSCMVATDSNGGGTIGGGTSGAVSGAQAKLVQVARTNKRSDGSTIKTVGGYCAAWVEDVYHAAGLHTDKSGFGNAIDYWTKWKSSGSSSPTNIPAGACVIGSGSGSAAGNTYGHIGIYLGDGNVADNIGSHRIVSLSDWIAFNKGTCGGSPGFRGWVWPFGQPIS